MRVTSVAVAFVLLFAGAAQAEFVGFDNDPANDGPLGDPLVSDIPIVNARLAACNVASETGIGSLAAGGADADFYQIFLPAGCIVTATVTPLSPAFTAPALKLSGGDAGGPFASSVGGTNSIFGPPSVGATINFVSGGIAPVVFNVIGAAALGYTPEQHGSVGLYQLTIATYPEPATLALLGFGGLALIRRRK